MGANVRRISPAPVLVTFGNTTSPVAPGSVPHPQLTGVTHLRAMSCRSTARSSSTAKGSGSGVTPSAWKIRPRTVTVKLR